MRQVLLPPKPNELEATVFRRCSWACQGTWRSGQAGSGLSRLMVGGTACFLRASTQASASKAAAAVSRWPVMLLVELTGVVFTLSPSVRARTFASAASPTGVLVAWQLT